MHSNLFGSTKTVVVERLLLLGQFVIRGSHWMYIRMVFICLPGALLVASGYWLPRLNKISYPILFYVQYYIFRLPNLNMINTVEPPNKGHFRTGINSADLFFVEKFSSLEVQKVL